ncbi:Alpha/Beta hydrolase protein [Myxozyma melibiosi]|uniref:Alpha/Beta hydrolase protein n=1 Tax=Myxozyma melibiosi TaxID=54550 RepID=A0ABR1EYG9_9ASCO
MSSSFFKLAHDLNVPNLHVTYTSVPVANSTTILGTDIYTYQPTTSTMSSYTESAVPRKNLSSQDDPKDTAAKLANAQNASGSGGGASNPWGAVKPSLGVVIAHPYPPLGGSKSDGLVRSLAHHFVATFETSVVVYAFNFRGVTTRTSWSSKTEQQDMLAVSTAMINAYNPTLRTVLLVGYSYGALISCKLAAEHLDTLSQTVDVALWLISPPLWPVCGLLTLSVRARDSEPQFYKFVGKVKQRQVATLPATAAANSPDGHVLVVYGTDDTFTRKGRFQKWIRTQHDRIAEEYHGFDVDDSAYDGGGENSAVSVVEIDGGSHFWQQDDVDMIWQNPVVQRFLSKVSGKDLSAVAKKSLDGPGSGASSVTEASSPGGSRSSNQWGRKSGSP